MQRPFTVRIVPAESLPHEVSEQMVVPVGISSQLDQEQMSVVDGLEQRAGVVSLGHRRATLGVEVFEDRSREQESEDLGGLAFEYLRSEEVGDRAWRLRKIAEEQIRNRFVAQGDRRHLDTGSPTLRAGREQLDLGARQLDSELEHDGGDFGPREAELVDRVSRATAHGHEVGTARELWLGSTAEDHPTRGR